MKLTLALPSLNLDEDEIRIPLCLPAFNKILQYGSPHRQSCTASAFYARYLWCGRLAQRPAQSLNMPSETVALATPVWQKMGLHQANVLTAEYLDVGTDEAERLCRDLSAFYGDIPWRFVPVLPELWLVSLPRAYRWGAKPVLDLGGLLGADDQPDGEDALEWLRVQTEIQMWLNAHPVNHNRKKRGLPELNGLWLWDSLHGSAQGGTLFADTVWSRFHPNRRALPDSFRAYAETAAHLPDTHHILLYGRFAPDRPDRGQGAVCGNIAAVGRTLVRTALRSRPHRQNQTAGHRHGRTTRRYADLQTHRQAEVLALHENL